MRTNLLTAGLVLALAAAAQASFVSFDTAGNGAPGTADNLTNNGNLISSPCSLSADAGIGTLAAGDVDYYRLDVDAGCFVNIITTPMTVYPTTPDTILRFLDAGLVQLAINDDGGGDMSPSLPNRGSALHLSIAATGTYFIEVTGFSGTQVGNYLMTVGVTPEPATLALLGAGLLVLARRRK